MIKERLTQDRVIQLMVDALGYSYLGNLKDLQNSNIREGDLKAWLRSQEKYTDAIITRAVQDLVRAAAVNPQDDLYPVNKAVYSILRYGVKVRDERTDAIITVNLIDWEHPQNNRFTVAEEVTVPGEHTKRPDVVVYVNGIALVVLELKRASVMVSEGIRQNLDNQLHRFIKPFFATIQFVLAGNDSQGLSYGTIKTPEKHFLRWKEENHTYDKDSSILDQQLQQLLSKERLLEMIHDFTVFDAGIKKTCRPNQYFGVKAAQEYIRRREGGIIWHSQGSGKSLTMVWLAKWIREHQENARLLIITDRTELDEQIEKVFKGVDESIYRTTSGQDLIDKLNGTLPWLLCSLVHKFGKSDEEAAKDFANELRRPANFQPKGNLFVFIDECHRTQSGLLHQAMKDLLPDALFIGFTGTPLLKTDQTSLEVFGSYIHTYKFNEAVEDGIVLDLLYEARDVDQRINDQKGVDIWFESMTRGMNDLPKAELKQQWGTMQKILSTRDRLYKIAGDILLDFNTKPRLRNGHGNALLVTSSIYEACRYYEIFQEIGFRKCAIITSYEPSLATIKGESTGEGETEKEEQYETYQRMLGEKSREQFEKDVKKQFIDEPANMQLLIVVDKLLTGFDAPACTYLYIDKQMQDHGLFQAICRVNRTEKEDKEFGYIVDYKDLFNSLRTAIADYTSEAFDNFQAEDIQGLLVDRLEKAKEKLEDALETVERLCEGVEPPRNTPQYISFFCGDTSDPSALKEHEEQRLTFYKAVVSLIRAYNNAAAEMKELGYTDAEASQLKNRVRHFTELRDTIKVASGDYIDLKQYEPQMRTMLDMYLSADPSRVISDFGEVTLLQLINELGVGEATTRLPSAIRGNKNAVAETLEANMRKVIIQEMPMNPAHYEKMSILLQELIDQRKAEAISYEEFLRQVEELARQIQPGKRENQYPSQISTAARQALYDNLGENIELVLALDEDIRNSREDSWIGNILKERAVKYAILRHVGDRDLQNKIFEIVKNQKEYI